MKRTDIYQKYIVKRTDGREEPEAVYFVLRIDRLDNWWDPFCRWGLRKMARRLMAEGDPHKNEFGLNLQNWVDNIHIKAANKPPQKGEQG